MSIVKPGLNIRVVTDIDITRETISVTASTIYEVVNDRITIAQIEPPIVKPHGEITITYLTRENGFLERRGFPAEVAALIDYDVDEKHRVKAVVADKTGDACPFSIRMFHRVEPTEESDIEMQIFQHRLKIQDISLRGAGFSHDRGLSIETGQVIDVCLEIGGVSYDLEARITRTWPSGDVRMRREIACASAEFVNMSISTQRALLRKLHQIERKSRSDEVSPG
jgi:hypothetical protein